MKTHYFLEERQIQSSKLTYCAYDHLLFTAFILPSRKTTVNKECFAFLVFFSRINAVVGWSCLSWRSRALYDSQSANGLKEVHELVVLIRTGAKRRNLIVWYGTSWRCFN